MRLGDTEVFVVKDEISELHDINNFHIDIVCWDVEAPSPKDQDKVRQMCANALNDAVRSDAGSIAFPPLGVKSGFPLIGCAKIMAQEILKHLKGETTLKAIVVCLDDDEAFKAFEHEMTRYIKHIRDDLGEEPFKTVDIIIELKDGIILIERSNPPYGWALPGGFLDPGEDLKTAAIREAKEETNMDLEDVREFKTYAEPGRDPRFHTASTVFIAKGIGEPKSGDDAKGLKVIKYADLLNLDYAFDHNQIIKEYLDAR